MILYYVELYPQYNIVLKIVSITQRIIKGESSIINLERI